MFNYLKSGREAIRLLYFLIIGLGLTNALTDLFIVNKIFVFPDNDKSILFLVFFSFIVRFFLGAYRVLAYDIDLERRKTKILIDMFGFFSQSLAFFVYSLSFKSMQVSQWMIIIICAIDLFWILLLLLIYKSSDTTTLQWLIHNAIILIILPLNIIRWQSIFVLFVVAALGFIFDLAINHDFYFAIKKTKVLKIFIYHTNDGQSDSEINKKLSEIILKISSKGHIPILSNKFKKYIVDEKLVNQIDYELLQTCDAIYFINLNKEDINIFEMIINKGIQVFANFEEIPEKRAKNTQLL